MEIGIDKIGFYTPSYYVDMAELAEARGVEPGKFLQGLGQSKMAVPPISQDPVTMACNAAQDILTDEDKMAIDYVIVGTESGIDQSKAAAIYVHDLLDINPYARCIEMKEACYGATAGLQSAVNHVARHPESKALVIASDIARYGLESSGESTQGAGAVALLITTNPRIAQINDDAVYYTGDIMDFWRPNYSDTAKVDGHYSTVKYLDYLDKVWQAFKEKNQLALEDLQAVCFHLPYTKMGLKALRQLLPEATDDQAESLQAHFENSRYYNRYVGNIYTGSLYLSLLSLLDQDSQLQAGDRIGLYSYGSGAVAEFYSLTLMPGYQDHLAKADHEAMLANRNRLSVADYETMFSQTLNVDGSKQELAAEADVAFQLVGLDQHKRLYSRRQDNN
ncbi:hydroxymethylglutaryl-CoA synthase [Aerococcus kribbianus]|uniref:Hydroxymethylglutaryl-CoA synthase n=1 Tax=Aerococcus kribbianus TaxID=2999064 RepID=A0A9X3FMZ8_9LACT|nr:MULTISPECIES: hydroxymethylglutaryl-CoA synthase [unclassified Aerococcus]MCZ0717249.1 hydroxymethylglutaryl-CoA synthase [Aerococcus sp. YH-aer221]MCZ0725537.1 hydroxymethylglutaryl-CoA synthase [Aerococcus sp. YH-aer222]